LSYAASLFIKRVQRYGYFSFLQSKF